MSDAKTLLTVDDGDDLSGSGVVDVPLEVNESDVTVGASSGDKGDDESGTMEANKDGGSSDCTMKEGMAKGLTTSSL